MIALKARVDAWLGRFTMYRLILWVLAVLAVYSMVLNALGWLTFGLPEMLVHLVLCLGLTYASNRLVAMLFKVRPHSESSLITGLLLYFLFWPIELMPTVQVPDLAGLVVACVLASASKYVLAFRGRHIFNPAAAGAFIAGLTGLNIATWWAATPAMLWLLLPGVLLVLYRTRRSLMAAVFLLISTTIVGSQLLSTAADPGAALWEALAQRPLLFFVGFMLTEPLTLPPRRMQQLGLAAVVGLLFAVPYNLAGIVANSPELALLIGNLLAFLAGQRGAVILTFKGSRPLTPLTTEFRFRPARPVRHAPGQFIELHLPHSHSDGKGHRRVFSITSAPDAPDVTFGVGTAEPVSTAKQSLVTLAPGDVVNATSVGGDFLPPRNPDTPVLLIAAGIGITPFMAHLAEPSGSKRDTVLLYLAKSNTELSYAPQLEATGARVIARTSDGSDPAPFMEDAGPDRIDHRRLLELIPDITAREVFVSGSPSAVASLRAAARRAGARGIHTDSFAGS